MRGMLVQSGRADDAGSWKAARITRVFRGVDPVASDYPASKRFRAAAKRFLAKLWSDEPGISSVEYAMLLAMIGGGIIMSVDMLATAVSNQMNDTAALFAEDTCGNDGSGDGTGGGGTGQGGDNTC